MKVYDAHVHAFNIGVDSEKLLRDLDGARVYGCCVFSNRPKEANPVEGSSFEERLDEVLAAARGYEGRIFPVLWIHPYEENILEKIQIAVDAGIVAFKIICTDFYPYEERCICVLKEIARLGKPVFFHSGILWDGAVSSKYNRPLNWEELLHIEGLRFSMGHCSWPWVDECIALYGKFLNTLNRSKTAEMFFDITPGTPPIYRKELLTKLYTIGYDVGDNVFFGTDGNASDYRNAWTDEWLARDRVILDELGVSLENRQKLYADNLMRFLGVTESTREKIAPDVDDAKPWSAVPQEVTPIIEKWYKRLGFPKAYDTEFYKALEEIRVSDAVTLETYDKNSLCGRRNLLTYLYLCEETARFYAEKQIPEEILLNTLKDIVVWTREWSNVTGALCLRELPWLARHLDGRLFKIGRLQFCMAEAERDIKEYGICRGDNVIEIHIPTGGPLTPERVCGSIDGAKDFFAKYFPQFSYTCFICHSWLLDDKLKEYLPEGSNILAFGNMFDKVYEEDSNALIRYLFRWDTNEQNLPHAVCNSNFATQIKKAVMRGEQFHDTLGVIKA